MTASMIAIPVRFVGLKLATVDKDSYEEIAQGVEVVCRTRRGLRIERPEFGVRSMVFDEIPANVSLEHVERAILDGEPRATVIVDDDPSALAAMILSIGVEVLEDENG